MIVLAPLALRDLTMGAAVETSSPKRSVGESLFQLPKITLGVLIALSFDAVLKWNADLANEP